MGTLTNMEGMVLSLLARLDALFFANFFNLVLMVFYVWADYGRGYLADDVAALNALYQALAFLYLADGALYLFAHEGELPWPSGWSMWSDWLNLLGNACFAATACLYPRESSEGVITAVLVIEALASLVNASSAICGFAGWWMESRLDTATQGPLAELCALFASPDAWAHITNFLPAVVYMGSSLAAAEINYARLSDLSSGAGAVRMPEILRLLARVYWYGDILWTVNAALWLLLWVRDQQYEEADGGDGGEGSGSGSINGSGSKSAGLLASGLKESLLDAPEGGAEAGAGAVARRMHARRRRLKKRLRDTQPYHLYVPFLRWFRVLCASREAYLELRGSHLVVVEEPPAQAAGGGPGSPSGSVGMSASSLGTPAAPPPSAGSKGGGGGGSGGGLSGKRVFTLIAVTSLAANAEAARRKDVGGGGVEMLDMRRPAI